MAPRIEEYEFGRVKIDGVTYRRDLIVCADGVREDWRRLAGHGLAPEDLALVLDEVGPTIVIIGSGSSGALTVSESTRSWIANRKVELIVLPTKNACEQYNQMASAGKVVAGLHLTC